MNAGRKPRRWTDADGLHLDVRGLAPPGPMVAILSLVDTGEAGGSFVAHLDRDPLFLYPELAERGWTATPIWGRPGAATTCGCRSFTIRCRAMSMRWC